MSTPTATRTVTPPGNVGAFSVITDGALRRGALAHRTGRGYITEPTGRIKPDGEPETRSAAVAGPACYPDTEYERADSRTPRYPAVTAGWADHIGVVPCMEPACFGP